MQKQVPRAWATKMVQQIKKLVFSFAALLGFSFFAAATPVQKNDVYSLSTQEEMIANLETATVNEYGVVDLGIHDFGETTILPLTDGFGCQCACC